MGSEDTVMNDGEIDVIKAHRAGIKEVVEWIEKRSSLSPGRCSVAMTYESRLEWQAKLKEWGVE